MQELEKQYKPIETEKKWRELWVNEPFTVDVSSDKEPFCVVIPPPNVTGDLHLGHAFDNTIIDTIIRFKRMQGYETLFQVGTDHAGISTQVLVERELKKSGLNRHGLGREKFLEKVWEWKEKYGSIISEQLQRLGISGDWSRERFTMDDGLQKAVRKQFVELYNQGKIYRSERIVNWDPKSQTTLSELEVNREERKGKIYTLAYELENGGSIKIATVRPETIFADQAIAVHPDDQRFSQLVGKKARIPLTDRWITIITDEAVEIDFGTGALKITPAHDPTDFEIGERHNLAYPSVIDLDAKLFSALVPEEFIGLDRFLARKEVIKALEKDGSLIEAKEHTISIGLSERTNEPVEPIISMQWWYNVGPAAQKSLQALEDNEIKIFPERYTKVNKDWLGKLRPWNISRQLWWGHQIPAWYDKDGKVYVADSENPYLDPPDNPKYAGIDLKQDEDVFDTWFSSNLWPFATLGWPDPDPYFDKFYPTSLLVTGYDILFFWVSRMENTAFDLLSQKPFNHVLLHGLVLDEKGQKMSKSKGNGVDPLEVMDIYGSDALRFAMTYVSTGGQDIRWDMRRVEMGRNFNNKLWNASRFAFMHINQELDAGAPESLADKWIMSRLQEATKQITEHLEEYELGLANRKAYDFVWSEFCDWYLEAAKPALYSNNARSRYILKTVLSEILKLLHPIVPFISSEIYQALGNSEQIAWAAWPSVNDSLIDEQAEAEFKTIQDAITGVRNLRAEANLNPTQEINIFATGEDAKVLKANKEVFCGLARANLLSTQVKGASFSQIVPGIELILPFEGLIDLAEWTQKQEKQIIDLEKKIAQSQNKLNNERFVANAPEAVVAEEQRRLNENNEVLVKIKESLSKLS